MEARRGVPDLTRSADIQLNKRVSLHRRGRALGSATLDNFPKRPGPHQRSRQAIILRLAALLQSTQYMANYRTVTIDRAGKPSRHRGFVCDNDDDAIVWAKHSLDDAPVELWSGARFVVRLRRLLPSSLTCSTMQR
jgi:hypothetical protein